jgi:hypothetical protein
MKLLLLILLTLFLFGAESIHAQEWRRIEPLKTTRADVEAILGQANGHYEVLYKLKDGKLSIEYSSGPCRPDRVGGWNVPENVVVSMFFSPNQHEKLSELKLDLKKLRKLVDEHVGGFVYYIDDEAGTTYAIQRGKLDYIEYGPPKKYDHLHCKNQSEAVPAIPTKKP